MNSLVVKYAFGAILVGAPLISSGQNRNATPVRNDVTLLTGPDLLSPATRPLESPSISSEIVTPARSIPEQKRASAEQRLIYLRAQRDALLMRKQEMDSAQKPAGNQVDPPGAPGTLRLAVPIRFDAQLPVTAPELLRFDSTLHSSPPPPKFQFQAAPKL